MGFDFKSLFRKNNIKPTAEFKKSAGDIVKPLTVQEEFIERCSFCGSKYIEKKNNMYSCLFCKKTADYVMPFYICKEIEELLKDPQKNKYSIEAKKVRYKGIDWDGKTLPKEKNNFEGTVERGNNTELSFREQYLLKLEEAIRIKGEKMTDSELIEFANANSLLTTHQMHMSEVRTDYAVIYRKISGDLEKKRNNSDIKEEKSKPIPKTEQPRSKPHGNPVKKPINNNKPISNINSSPELNKEMYRAKIEDAIRAKGDILTDQELIDFANKNNLLTTYKMHMSEIRTDYATIYRRISGSLSKKDNISNTPASQVPIPKTPKQPLHNGTPKPISPIKPATQPGAKPATQAQNTSLTRDEYLKKLEEEVKKCGLHPLSSNELFNFIRSNKINENLGLHVSEVESDMKSIIWKLKKAGTTNIPVVIEPKKVEAKVTSEISNAHEKEKVNRNAVSPKRENIPSKEKDSLWTSSEKSIAENVGKLLKDYPDLIDDPMRLKGALADVLVQKNREVFMLSALSSSGILSDINRCSTMDKMLRDRYISIMENNYGTEKKVATKMILVWFYAYGKMILGKEAYTEF